MQESKTQPREDTGAIKTKLKSYGDLQRRIDHLITRLENLMDTIDSLPGADYSGMPRGSSDRTSKAERYVEKKDDLEQKIDRLVLQEKVLRKELEEIASALDDPDEQAVIEMKYLDTQNWQDVAFSLFGNKDDYDDNAERYMKRTFRIHGDALQHLAAIFTPKTPPASA